jgi:AbiTii
VQVFEAISQVQDMADQAKADKGHVDLSPPGGAELATIMTRERRTGLSRISDVYWSVSSVELHGIVDRVRTICTELVAEVRGTQRNDQTDPKPEDVRQAVMIVLSGRARLGSVILAQAANGSQVAIEQPEKKDNESPGWSRARKIGAALVGVATVAGTVGTFLALHH